MESCKRLKVSIITVVYNGEATIEDAVRSVAEQTYPNIEYIVIDGGSKDNTLSIVNRYRNVVHKVVSEPDHGIYDAMNKGIREADGDIIGILNADDMYVSPHCIWQVVDAFVLHGVDAVLGALYFVKPDNLKKPVRVYHSIGFLPQHFQYGNMPPHPSTFILKRCYDEFGLYKTDYKIGADFELLARFICKKKIRYYCLAHFIVKMRTGGVSTRGVKSNLILNREILRACRDNLIPTNYIKIYAKYFNKLKQLMV